MKRELRLFFKALSFYTRLPVPAAVHQDNAAELPDAIRYLPVVGWICGLLAAAVFVIANYLFGYLPALILSMAATILMTGAFHEDGFSDVCDGFGGGWTKEKILLIMKDSRLGTYGVTGLFLLLGIKLAVLYQLLLIHTTDIFFVGGVFIVAHSLSRFAAIMVMFNHPYARMEDSKAAGAVEQGKSRNLLIAGFLTILPLVALIFYTSRPILACLVFPVLLLSLYLGSYFKKWIGGYTGDCLGAVQQLTEVVIYLSLISLWKFI